jgi:hypothetical protein
MCSIRDREEEEDPIDTTAIVTRDSIYTSPNGEAPVGFIDATGVLNATTDPIDRPDENSYWKLFKERSPVPVSRQ